MHPALFTLMRLNGRAMFRRMLRGIRTPRGAIFFGVGLVMFALWIVPSLFGALVTARSNPETVRTVIPLALLAFCLTGLLTSGGNAAVYFTPSEVDFLFAGPFSRRELLGYKLIKGAAGSVVTSFFFSLVFLAHATWWIAAFIGYFLAILFVQLFSMTIALVAQTVTERAYNLTRKLVLAGIAAVIALSVFHYLKSGTEAGPKGLLDQFRDSWTGRCFLAPFSVFGRTITAETLVPDLVGWSVLAVMMDLALITLVMKLDTNYMEVAIATSQKMYERLQRVRRGGSAIGWSARGTRRLRFPRLPRLGGAGPIAWRQLTTALRNSPSFLIILLLASVGIGFGLRGSMIGEHLSVALPGLVVWMTVIFTMMLRFDFRSDLDHMEWLKMSPLRPIAIAAGELAAPVLIMCLVQLTMLVAFSVFVEIPRFAAISAALFVLPLNVMLFGLENFFFLNFPTRLVAVSPGDFQALGRQMVLVLAKMMLLGVSVVVIAGPGFLAYWLSGWWWPAFAIVSWFLLSVIAVAVVPCVAWAYQRFDVSVDTPA